MPNYNVPAQKTTYACKGFAFLADKKRQVIRFVCFFSEERVYELRNFVFGNLNFCLLLIFFSRTNFLGAFTGQRERIASHRFVLGPCSLGHEQRRNLRHDASWFNSDVRVGPGWRSVSIFWFPVWFSFFFLRAGDFFFGVGDIFLTRVG
jgi:hypothetical protein